jgi:hypothetical protein
MNQEEDLPKFNEQKTTETAALLLHMNGGTMNYMKLIKLLYFVDKMAIRARDFPITYDTYYSMKNGQILSTVLDLINLKKKGVYWHKYIKRTGAYNVELADEGIQPDKLSPLEVDIIKSVYIDLGGYDQYSLGKLTKRGKEYKSTTSSIKTTIDSVYADLGYTDADIKQIKERMVEKAYIDKLLKV